MTSFRFRNASVTSGAGALEVLRTSALDTRVFVVSGRHVVSDQVLHRRVTSALGERLVGWEAVTPLPSEEGVGRVAARARASAADTVVAIGGGSVIDTAKTVSVLAANAMDVRDALAGALADATVKLRTVAVPTLCGSGSEVTPFSVLYADARKHSLESPLLQPDIVLADPDVVLAPPAPPASAAFLDAVAQAAESLWAVRADAESEGHAGRCLAAAAAFLQQDDPALRRASLGALSLAGGMAIAISRTTAAHALSYPLTILHGVPHGVACVATLPAVLAWNADVQEEDCLHPRGSAFVRERVAEIAALLDTLGGVTGVAERLRVPVRLGEWGIGERDLDALVAACANPERMNNNPRRITAEAVRALYAQAL